MKAELVDFPVHVKHDTARAWLATVGDKDYWLPKSQCQIDFDGRHYTLTMPEWLAKEKGLI